MQNYKYAVINLLKLLAYTFLCPKLINIQNVIFFYLYSAEARRLFISQQIPPFFNQLIPVEYEDFHFANKASSGTF